MAVKELGRSEAEVMDQLARLALHRRNQVLRGKPWPLDAYVAAAVTLILSARSVIQAAEADTREQIVRGFDGRSYVLQGDVLTPARPVPVKTKPPVHRERPGFLRSMLRRLFG